MDKGIYTSSSAVLVVLIACNAARISAIHSNAQLTIENTPSQGPIGAVMVNVAISTSLV